MKGDLATEYFHPHRIQSGHGIHGDGQGASGQGPGLERCGCHERRHLGRNGQP